MQPPAPIHSKLPRAEAPGMSKQLAKVYELAFPVATVYRAWVSSDTVIPPATAMDILPEVGGHYRLHMDLPDFKGRNDGVFSAVVPE